MSVDQRNVVRQTEENLLDLTPQATDGNQILKTKSKTDDSYSDVHGNRNIQAPLLPRMSPNLNDEDASVKESITEPKHPKNKNIKIRKIQQIEFSPSPTKLDERRNVRRMLAFASPESDLCLTPTNSEKFKYSSPMKKVHKRQALSGAAARNSPKYEKSDCHFSPSSSSNARQEPNLSLLVARFHEVGHELQAWSREDRQHTINRRISLPTILEEGNPEFPPYNSEQNVLANFKAGAHSSLNFCVRL